jgi:hypothetical protein
VSVRAFDPVTVVVLPDPVSRPPYVNPPPLMLSVPPPEPIVMPRFCVSVTAALVRSVAPFEIWSRLATNEPGTPPS